MQYLIQGKLIAPEVMRLPHVEFVELLQTKWVPTLKLLVGGNAAGKVLAGGMPAGGRDFVMIADLPEQGTHRVVRQFLQSLPLFEYYEWQATPLETFDELLKLFDAR